jgi:hypothetical protein
MVPGWVPFKIVSDSPTLYSRWPLLLKIEISSLSIAPLGTIPARFGLIWFSGFRGEDLNAIFYQNMPNLHNRYISAERKTLLLKIEISSNGQNCSILSQNVPKFELCKHNDELFSIYYGIFL